MFILWHTRAEINAIKKYGGRYLLQNGFDGIVNGRPVEVRAIRDKKETRFRLQRNVHNDLLRGGGSYIFIDARNGRKKYRRVSARVVGKKLKHGKYYKDRSYPHKFLRLADVF